MQYSKSNLEKLYARLTIEDEEEGGMIVEVGEVQEKKETMVLVGEILFFLWGRFLTEHKFSSDAKCFGISMSLKGGYGGA